jgi:hypothetical protein
VSAALEQQRHHVCLSPEDQPAGFPPVDPLRSFFRYSSEARSGSFESECLDSRKDLLFPYLIARHPHRSGWKSGFSEGGFDPLRGP